MEAGKTWAHEQQRREGGAKRAGGVGEDSRTAWMRTAGQQDSAAGMGTREGET